MFYTHNIKIKNLSTSLSSWPDKQAEREQKEIHDVNPIMLKWYHYITSFRHL